MVYMYWHLENCFISFDKGCLWTLSIIGELQSTYIGGRQRDTCKHLYNTIKVVLSIVHIYTCSSHCIVPYAGSNKCIVPFAGSNKVCFVVTNHSLSEHLTTPSSSSLISPQLQARLYSQSALQTYLDNHQVLSWFKKPSMAQIQRLLEISQLNPNPQGQNCTVL